MRWNFFKKAENAGNSSETEKSVKRYATPPLSFFKNLIPICDLPENRLLSLQVAYRKFHPGENIFTRGDQIEWLAYVTKGIIFMEASNGAGYQVDATTFKACYPLSTGSEHKFSAIAKSDVTVIYFPLNLLQDTQARNNNPLLNPAEVPAELRTSLFFKAFCEAYHKNQLSMPSLPDVAIRLRAAIQNDIDIADAVKIINLDPVVSSKLIQVVNSPAYRSLKPASSCFDAVNRLGLRATQNLATSIALKNIFRSQNKKLNAKLHETWKESIYVASISHTLAAISQSINADEALLAGLVHNLGVLPVITFAGSLPEDRYSMEELCMTITAVEGILGEYILEKWRFPVNIQKVPLQLSNWFYDDGNPNLQLHDLVLLAKFHSQFGTIRMNCKLCMTPNNKFPKRLISLKPKSDRNKFSWYVYSYKTWVKNPQFEIECRGSASPSQYWSEPSLPWKNFRRTYVKSIT
jgi:HD-like signal output (HDOD) protein